MRILYATLCAILLFGCAARGQQRFSDLEIRPTVTGVDGSLSWVETNGAASGTATNKLTILGPASLASNVTLRWNVTGNCNALTNGGVLTINALNEIVCEPDDGGGGGSSFYQTMRDAGVDQTQRGKLNFTSATFGLNDDAGGDETEVTVTSSPADSPVLVGTGRSIGVSSPITGGGDLSADRTISCPTCVTTNTSQTITGEKTFSSSNLKVRSAIEIQNSFGTTAGFINSTVTNIIDFRNSSSGLMMSMNSGTNTLTVSLNTLAANGDLTVFDDATIGDELIPDSDGTGSVGTSARTWDEAWFDDKITFDSTLRSGTAVMQSATYSSAEAMEFSALAISSSGSMYIRNYSGGDVTCSGITDGWFGYRRDTNELQICEGGSVLSVTLAP